MIEDEMTYYDKYGPNLFPAVVINNQTFRGQLEIEAVFSAICSGFHDLPKYCKKFMGTDDINRDDLITLRGLEGFHSYRRVFRLIIVLILLSCCILFCYRRSAKRAQKVEIKEQIESAVNQYLALSNTDTEARGRAQMSELQSKN